MATFPGAIFAPSTKVDGVDFYLAAHMNDAQNEIIAAETAIGQEGNSGLVEGRLTLTTGEPVTTADVTGTTIYFTPFRGARLALHDGTGWVTHILTQISIAVPNTTATMYDIFVYSNAGTPTLEALVWTNDTTRATALTTLDGVYVKTGATTRRYLGSFRTDDNLSGNATDTVLRRYLWNYYNRVDRKLIRYRNDSHTYNTATIRAWDADPTNTQLLCAIGLVEDAFVVGVSGDLTFAAGNSLPYLGVGINSTTAATGALTPMGCVGTAWLTNVVTVLPRVGYNFLVPLEFSNAAGTAPTWPDVQTIATIPM